MAAIITSLYKKYFQKSKPFLYPALGIRRGSSIIPIETYMAWENVFSHEQRKLCCVYKPDDSSLFKTFEKTKLQENKLFHSMYLLEGDQICYAFDFDPLAHDWDCVLHGKYSKISEEYKSVIRTFSSSSQSNSAYINSFLYPEKHFSIYSDLMGVSVQTLRDVGELCDKPDLERETLRIPALDLNLFEI